MVDFISGIQLIVLFGLGPVQLTILPQNLTGNESNLVVLNCDARTFLHIIGA